MNSWDENIILAGERIKYCHRSEAKKTLKLYMYKEILYFIYISL